jgi:hypothetical protein
VAKLKVHALPITDRFLHVIYEFRYLALAGGAWKTYGPNGDQSSRRRLAAVIPGGSTLVRS